MRAFLILTAAVVCLGSAGHAVPSRRSFVLKDTESTRVSIEVPTRWKAVEGFYGMPLTILGPVTGKEGETRRPVIHFVPSSLVTPHLTLEAGKASREDIAGAEKEFSEGKARWFKKRAIQEYKFLGYDVFALATGEKLHRMGVEYVAGGVKFVERSYFGRAGKRFVHLKSLVPNRQLATVDRDVSRIVGSLRCE